jgi:ATP-binding cassette, subfamily B, bacterial HlyB/CyaB
MNAPELNPDARVSDPGLSALVTIARFHNIAADAAQIKHAAATATGRFTDKELVLSARSLGLKARIVAWRREALGSTPLPALVLDRDGRHFILARTDGKTGLILEPDAAAPTIKPPEEIAARSTGQMLLSASRVPLGDELARFDFSWFIPAIVRYRKLLPGCWARRSLSGQPEEK